MYSRWESEIREIIAQLTLEEKIGMIHGDGLFRTKGVQRLGIPPLKMSDGPMGVRAEFKNDEWVNTGTTEDYVTYLPSNSALASTWNKRLAWKAGCVLGEEARGRGKDVILAPGINIKRSPLCGRNFEYMSEDPKLIEEMCVPLIQGIQEHDVAACVKHFAANSQETQRLMVDTIVDEQTLNEIYFPGFLAAVEQAGSYSIMGAYNKLNGEHCCTSESLLNKTLREDWQYDGAIISDWGAVHDTELAARSALDIEMDVKYDFSKHFMADALKEKIEKGELSEHLVNEKVGNILRLMFRLKMIGTERTRRKAGEYNTRSHQDDVKKVAEESMILLKNDNNVLPLDRRKIQKLAVIGQNAAKIHSNGGGSAEIKALYEISPLMGIMKYLGGNVEVTYAKGYVIPKKDNAGENENWQAKSTDENVVAGDCEDKENVKDTELSDKYLEEALRAAESADAVIFVGGLDHDYDVEGLDRKDIKLPYEQDRVIKALLEARPDTVIVMVAGSVVAMPWVDSADTILWSYYAGMESGTALADILFGKVNPSGRLPETMIKAIEDCPAHSIGEFGKTDSVEYKEKIMVGYRHYDTQQVPVLFPFGHGLSYTRFDYYDLRVEADRENQGYRVSVTVQNNGDRAGMETVQIYLSRKDWKESGRPVHELKGFCKVSLAPGERKRAKVILRQKDFSVYSVDKHDFELVTGSYTIEAGASSRDIRLAIPVKIL